MMVVTTEVRGSSDESLAERARRGEDRAFEALVARYERRIYRLALRMCGNEADAEEISQETFFHAHRGLRAFQGNALFGTWLYRIAMNECLIRRRSSKRRPLELLDTLSPQFADLGTGGVALPERADDLLQSKTLKARVHAALSALDEPSRSALVLRDLEELGAEEAGAILGVSAEAVRKRAHRARLKLRELLGDLVSEWK